MRVLLTVAYDGTAYCGFQLQQKDDTVARRLNRALTKAYGTPLAARGASRTDAGVHAVGQRALFEIDDALSVLPLDKLPRILNSHLPSDIAVTNAIRVDDGFHVVKSAKRKTYRYQIQNAPCPDPLARLYAQHVPNPLDLARMRAAAAHFVCTRDFKACMATGGRVRTTVRTVTALDFSRQGDLITMTITGGGFLYNMVRIIAGTLIEVGMGRFAPEDMPRLLDGGDRAKLGRTAAACGLTLMSIEYE